MLRLWNTATRALEEFIPVHPPKVGMYTCGPTVYNPLQLGNWRKYIEDDLLHRTLIFLGYEVTHVTNITDVGHIVDDADVGDDKIEREAKRAGQTAWDIAKRYEQSFIEGMKAFRMRPLAYTPRATEHIAEQIALVQMLEQKGYTYQTSDGIYFDTAKFPAYGRLSGQKLAEKEAGLRVEVSQEKRQPSDFALWKFSPTQGPKRDMEWPSPWGMGFPGWHIECSAMSVKYLGQPFDIHTGGVDHIAIHHENEIAQTEAATGKPLARYWLHYEFLLVDGGRMGKSLGNGYTIQDLQERGFTCDDYRFFCLGAHYRSKLNFTWEAMTGAKQGLANLKAAFLSWENQGGVKPVQQYLDEFRAALEDDLNMPKALAVVWEVAKAALSSEEKRATLLVMDTVLGLGMEDWVVETVVIPPDIQALVDERWAARLAKNWSEADRLRDILHEHGWLMHDGKETYELTRVS